MPIHRDPKDKTLTIRLTTESRQNLEAAIKILPYAPSITSIVERGIVLAAEEMTNLATLLRERQAEGNK